MKIGMSWWQLCLEIAQNFGREFLVASVWSVEPTRFSALNLISRLSNQGIEEETKLTQRISDMHF